MGCWLTAPDSFARTPVRICATLRFPQKKHPQEAPIPEADLSAPQSNFSTPSEALLPQERPR